MTAYRTPAHRLIRFLFDTGSEPPTYALVEGLFIKLLGLVYFVAFGSLAVQITGLIGARGLLPVGDYLQSVHNRFGSESYRLLPTLFWLNASDALLTGVCVLGAALGLVLIAGYAHRLILIVLFLLYLSLVSVGQDFLGFQWDALLLEAGFLAIFLGDSWLVIWLYRWLVFRLLFLSGAVKLLSGDPTWRGLTALNFHYETQPLPTPLAWAMHQLPAGFQQLSVVVVFVIELGAPFLILAPRRLRFLAAAAVVFLQALIAATGNYCFFNLLTAALCVFLLDDAALRRWLPARVSAALRRLPARRAVSPAARGIAAAVGVMLILVSSIQVVRAFGARLPQPARELESWVAPFQIVNPYGLFAVMTTSRPEIIIEGSNDNQTWLAYEFKYKPGDLRRPPTWVAPHQPRLDWQMWFAALGSCSGNPWLPALLSRLQQGTPEVLALLGHNPFPDAPPRYVRAALYNYHFTDFATWRATGAWWQREPMGDYICDF